jgi:hypothetical protein
VNDTDNKPVFETPDADAERDAAIVRRFKAFGSNNQRLGALYSANEVQAAAILNAPIGSGISPFERGVAAQQIENLLARARVAAVARAISDRGAK